MLESVIQNVDGTPGKYLENVGREVLREGEPNWGRMAVIATVAQKLSLGVEDKEELATSLATIVTENIPAGGWPRFIKNYSEGPKRRLIKQIIKTLGIVVGLYWLTRT